MPIDSDLSIRWCRCGIVALCLLVTSTVNSAEEDSEFARINPLESTSEYRAGFDWWSLQPLRRVKIPTVKTQIPRSQPFDDFISEKLESRGLKISPQADRRVLIRRVAFDLLGLPPSPGDTDQFVQDEHPDAFERSIDRLLSSPHYGERWARHWLDVIRFGESNGFERDLPRTNAWPYRDWVVEALNRDLPYDEFARWQLAGDLMEPDSLDAMKSVGFLVAGPHNTVVPAIDSMRASMRQDELEDIVGTVSQTFLGLTLNCARCHDHKFDPITTREYYQFASLLSGIDHGEREFTPPEINRQLTLLKARIDNLTTKLNGEELSERIPSQNEVDNLRQQLVKLASEGTRRVYTAIATQPGPMKVHTLGSVTLLGEQVDPAGLKAIRGLSPGFGLRPDAIESHRRQALANWITDTRNSLFARVMANRVWHYHFGVGLVETPNDLGFNGGTPSHPELLEWMAHEFQAADRREVSVETRATVRDRGAFSLKRLPHGGVHVWFETHREPTLDRTVSLMAPRGRIILMAGRASRPEFPVGPFYVKDLRMFGFAMFNGSPEEQRGAADKLNSLYDFDRWKPLVGTTMSLAEAAAAHQLQEDNTLKHSGTLRGKIVLTP